MGSYPTGVNGFARVNARNPEAFAICDRCGFRWNRSDLTWQFDWRGAQLQNLRILVCHRCVDEPNDQLRAYSPPPDPLPIVNPRPDQSDEGSVIVLTTVAAASTQLLPADPTRNYVTLAIPPSFGVAINPGGGTAGLGIAGSIFYPPGSSFTLYGPDAQSAMNYWCAVAGLTLVITTDINGEGSGAQVGIGSFIIGVSLID